MTDILPQIADSRSSSHRYIAGIRDDIAGDNFKERRFARTVCPDNRNTVSHAYVKSDIFKQVTRLV